MLHTAICEDDAKYAEALKGYLLRYGEENDIIFRIAHFQDGEAILKANEYFSLVFMDIQMPVLDGISAAKKLRELFGPNFALFFITNHASFAIRGYEAEALDFIVKPMTYFDFSSKMERALRFLSRREEKKITIEENGDALVRISYSDLHYIEMQDHYALLHTSQGIKKIRTPLKELLRKLPDERFVRINRCYLINLDHLQEFSGNEAIVNGESLLVSRGCRKPLLNKMALFFGK